MATINKKVQDLFPRYGVRNNQLPVNLCENAEESTIFVRKLFRDDIAILQKNATTFFVQADIVRCNVGNECWKYSSHCTKRRVEMRLIPKYFFQTICCKKTLKKINVHNPHILLSLAMHKYINCGIKKQNSKHFPLIHFCSLIWYDLIIAISYYFQYRNIVVN